MKNPGGARFGRREPSVEEAGDEEEEQYGDGGGQGGYDSVRHRKG